MDKFTNNGDVYNNKPENTFKISVADMKVGTRDSELAVKQTNLVIEKLKEKFPSINFKIECMKTLGDKILDVSLSKIGSKALFTKELEVALDQKHVDFVVHSLKDLPTTLPDGLVIGAVLLRENPSDAVILHSKYKNTTLDSLPTDSVVGTSSLRRIAQLKRKLPHLKFESIRGNLNTRLKKLEESGKYDAIVLAAAGVIRMGWEDKISQYLDYDDCMYAVGQGALAVECRESDISTLEQISPLTDANTLFCVTAERAFMKSLEGGCSVPLAVNCKFIDNKLCLKGGVWSLDGSEELTDSLSCSFKDLEDEDEEKVTPSNKALKASPVTYCGLVCTKKFKLKMESSFNLGIKLADALNKKGAKAILDEAKAANSQAPNVPPSSDNKNGSSNVPCS